jgi:acetyltransferase-like isoleucine patch superfamily enzyme
MTSYLKKGMTLFKKSPNSMKVKFLKKFGPVGENLEIGKDTVVYAKKLKIGKNVTIGSNTFIMINKELILEDYSKIGSNCRIENIQQLHMGKEATIAEHVEVGGMHTSRSKLVMGDQSVIFPHCFINTTREVKLGSESCIGGYSIVMTHSSWSSILDGYPVQFDSVSIGDNVYIPWKVFILPGVTIGNGSVIGGGSLVTKDIPEKSLAVGVPAKIIKDFKQSVISSEEKIKIMKNIIKDFEDYLINVKGLEVEKELKKNHSILSCEFENKRKVLFSFSKQYPRNLLSSKDILISLTKLPSDSINELNKENIYWLDLDRKKGWINREDRWPQWVRGFLGRYGIRIDLIH